jgi:cobalt-zinc-cadmium efflux system membrane fusion protein
VAAALAAGGLLLYRVSGRDRGEPPPEPPGSPATVRFPMEQQWLIRMMLAKVERRAVAPRITATGRVVPAFGRHAIVAPPVGGLLSGPLPRVGQAVERGQPLAVVRQTPTAAEALSLETARTMLAVETARLEAERRRLGQAANEARSRMLLAIIEADHAKRLYDRKAYSLNQLQQAQHELKRAETDYDAAKEQLAALEQLAASRRELPAASPEHRLEAPLSGIVSRVHKSPGERAGAGEPVLEIVDLAAVWVEAPVFEKELGRLERNLRARITTPAWGERRFPGTLVNVGAVVDERSRAATVLFEIANPDRALRIGMQASVEIDAGSPVPALLIPRESVLEVEGRHFVYVLRTGEEFERRAVRLGEPDEGGVVVLEGLSEGERVVSRGARQILQREASPSSDGGRGHAH